MTSIRNSRRGSRHLGDLETQSPLSKNQLEHQYFFSKDLPPDQHFKSQKPRLIDDFSELNPEDYDNLSYPVEVRCLVKKGTYLEIDNADDLRTHVDKWAKKMLKTGTDGGRVAKGQDRVKIQKHGKDIKPNLANPILGKRTSLVSTTESAPSLSVTSESLLEGDLPTSYPGIDSQTLLLSDRRTPVDIRALLDGQVRKLDKMMNSITAVAAKQNGKGRDSNNLQQLKDRFLRTVRRAQKTYERGLDDLGVMPKKSALNTGQEASTKTRDKMDTSKSGSKVIDLTVGYVDSEAEG
jgi:hypothetical protein